MILDLWWIYNDPQYGIPYSQVPRRKETNQELQLWAYSTSISVDVSVCGLEIESPASEEACNGSANEKEVDLGSHGHVQPNGSICTCDESLARQPMTHDSKNRNVGCQQLTPFLLSHRVVHSIVPGTFGKKTEQTRWKCFTLQAPGQKKLHLNL